MPDDIRSPHDATPMPAPITIHNAMQALPLETPARNAWPLLVKQLPAPTPPRWPWAIAASVLLAVLLVARFDNTSAPTPTAIAAAPNDPLPPLLAESAQLEALLAAAANSAGTSAPMVMLSADLEDRLQGIDGQLASTDLSDKQRLPLWQQRVEALRELAGLQSTQQWLAARGEQAYEGALVVAY